MNRGILRSGACMQASLETANKHHKLMSRMRGAVVVDEERCKGCNLCVVACPTHSLALSIGKVNHKGYAYCQQTNLEVCTGCTSCAIVCPDGCITVYRKKEE